MFTVGTSMNGMSMSGFMTIGRPKMTGSLMLKMPGTRASLPSCLMRFDLQNSSIAMMSESVEPAPPKVANRSWNC